jgi:hypothetical protein
VKASEVLKKEKARENKSIVVSDEQLTEVAGGGPIAGTIGATVGSVDDLTTTLGLKTSL